MKMIAKYLAVIFMVTIFIIMYTDTALAIRRAGGGGWGATTLYGSKFNPAAIETFFGEVVSVEKFTPYRRMAYGYLVMVKRGDKVTPVHVGPAWFVNQQTMKIEPGDLLQVTGSRFAYNEGQAIMAMEVRKGEQILILRDEDGVPPWSSIGETGPE